MSELTAILVVAIGSLALVALLRRDQEAIIGGATGGRSSWLARIAWYLTCAALLSAVVRVLILY